MSDTYKVYGPSATRHKRRLAQFTRRAGAVVLVLFWVLTIVGGVVLLIAGLEGKQEASRLAAAPICTAGRAGGCRLEERVTVIDLNTYYPARGPSTRFVKVQRPEGGIQNIQDHDGDLFPLLYVTEALNAELWKGAVIKLDDGAGHFLIADDSPVITGSVLPFTGTFLIVAGAALLAVTLRGLVLQKRLSQRLMQS